MSPAPGAVEKTVQVGSVLAGRYHVESLLGSGGMGSVFRVEDLAASGRQVALKWMGNGEGERAQWARLRFRHEFHAMAQLRHPHIVEVYDYGQHAGAPFYTMQLLDGADLRHAAPMPFREACRILREVASALALLHTRRLVHRDLSLRNVRLTSDGRAKLIDFGLLATAGSLGTPIGTPPLVAPEAFRRLPLDHRADLYSLGALAYFLLTGRHAYPATHLQDLPLLWEQPLAAPSKCVEGLPAELEALVLSMLRLEPLARPVHAGEVMDRLVAIGQLEAAVELEVQHGYLASASLVGRRRELAGIRRKLFRSVKGTGCSILLEASTGMGKSRLLRQVEIEAQVAGATVLTATAGEAGRSPFGVLRQLTAGLLASAPDEALAAAAPLAGTLARVLPEVAVSLGPVALDPPVADAGEDRVHVQNTLLKWLLDVSDRRPLVLLVDDLQRADEASAAVLAALAHAAEHHPLMLIAARRLDDATHAPGPVAAIRAESVRMRLRGLSEGDIVELVRAHFGDVPNPERLALWLKALGGGSPLVCTELVRLLVERGEIRYRDGVWALPDKPVLDAVPGQLGALMDRRVGALNAPARALAEALAVHGGEATLELCVALAAPAGEEAVFRLLDELVDQEVLLAETEVYRFRHDGSREALLRGLDTDRRNALHLRIGELLLGNGPVAPEREAEVGHHLLRGGRAREGAELLARAGRHLFDLKSFAEAIGALEPALEVLERDGTRPLECFELRRMLMLSGALADPAAAFRHADRMVADLRTYSGLGGALRLRRFLPAGLALFLGVLGAGLRWVFTARPLRGPTPLAALLASFEVLPPLSMIYAFSFREAQAEHLAETLRPVTVLEGRIPQAAYMLTASSLGVVRGQGSQVCREMSAVLEIVAHDHKTPVPELNRRILQVAPHFMMGIYAALEAESAVEKQIQALERLNMRFFRVSKLMLRLTVHRLRGEEDEAQKLERELELLFVQGGSMWLWEFELSWVSALAFGLTRDIVGLKRCLDKLAELGAEGCEVEAFTALTLGEYHRERGDLVASRQALERALALISGREFFIRPPIETALAETLIAQGELDAAAARLNGLLESRFQTERGAFPWILRARWILAFIDAARGDFAAARTRLDAAVADASARGVPALMVNLFEVGARIDLGRHDLVGARRQLQQLQGYAAVTRNPALIARAERIRTEVEHAAPGSPGPPDVAPVAGDRSRTATLPTSRS